MGASVAIFTADGDLRVIAPEDECELASETTCAEMISFQPGGLSALTTITTALAEPLRVSLKGLGLAHGRIGVELREGVQPASYVIATHFRSSFLELLEQILPKAVFCSCDDLVESMQASKTPIELQQMQIACNVAQAGFAEALKCVQPGVREPVIAGALQSAFEAAPQASSLQRSYGCFFCMSGENSAKAAAAYARTRNRTVEPGDLVMIHANTCADGYWTDITRTFSVGEPSQQQIRMRKAIDEARTASLASIRPGVMAREVDRAARSVMESRGFGPAFKHATGHGVGFAAANGNAQPRIHPLSLDILEEGTTFNIEPAIYIDGYGGMRHCDVVAVTSTGVQVLSSF